MSTEQTESPKPEIVQNDFFIRIEGDNIFFRPECPFDVWFAKTQGILEFTRRSMKVAGQLLILGEDAYGEKAWQVVDAMRYNPKTLANAMYVCKNIAAWHDGLSFAHHEVVAALPAPAQEELLNEAEKETLPVAKLRKLRKQKFPDAGKKGKTAKPKSHPNYQDEHEALEAARLIGVYLIAEEALLPFRQWPANRLKAWKPFLTVMTKIARRSIIETH